jgi:hypothetical protein
VNIAADARYFWVGFGAEGLTVRNNRFEGCNYGGEKLAAGPVLAAVNVFSDVANGIGSAPVHQDVTLERNTIIDTPGRAILIASAKRVRLAHNSVVDANTRPAMMSSDGPACSVFITRSSEVTIDGHSERATQKTYGEGVAVDAQTTANIDVVRSRHRPSRPR